MKEGKALFWICLLIAIALCLAIEVNTKHINLNLPVLKRSAALASSLDQQSSYTITGKPTITASFIDDVLRTAGSPASGLGSDLYTLGVKYGIDPVYALAFFQHESSFGLAGMARVTHSLGNLRCIAGFSCIQGYAGFPSWQAGFEAWYALIQHVYIMKWGLHTVAQIIPTYAPSSDHNNVTGYIAAIEHAVNAWRTNT